MKRVSEKIQLNLSFQKRNFFVFIIAALALCALGYGITLIPKIGGTGLILIAICYFLPSLVCFDFSSSYQDEFKFNKVLHPKRYLIMLLNFIFGWTVIGWLILLWWACTPGHVIVEKFTYTE